MALNPALGKERAWELGSQRAEGATSVTLLLENKHFNSIEPQHLFHRQTYFV